MRVCFERGCNQPGTRKMVRPCCKSEDPLCGTHATARKNSLALLARLGDQGEVICEVCQTKTSQLPTVI